MKIKGKNFKGFTLVEVLLVMGIFIILSVIGFNGFLSIRESFIARENVELIIQDIESTKLKAMNMEGGKDETWIYGFGIDFRNADEMSEDTDYNFFKWCSPVTDYGGTFTLGVNPVAPTGNILPNYLTEGAFGFNEPINSFPLCETLGSYNNGRLAFCYFTDNACHTDKTGLINTNEISTLLDREKNQMEILFNSNEGSSLYPAFLFFESLTGRAIIYNRYGLPQSYEDTGDGVIFNRDNFVPLDIVLHRKRSDKFDLITVYPNSGEVIHYVYDEGDQTSPGNCTPGGTKIINYFSVDGKCYDRFGIEEEINSFRD